MASYPATNDNFALKPHSHSDIDVPQYVINVLEFSIWYLGAGRETLLTSFLSHALITIGSLYVAGASYILVALPELFLSI